MSTSENSMADASSATAIETEAADWVADRRNAEDWTQDRQAELDAWLAQSLAHRVAFVRIEATWRRTDRLAALNHPVGDQTDADSLRKPRRMRIAVAIGVIVATSAAGANYLFNSRAELIATPVGGQRNITLADGSQIELNTDTSIRVDLTAKKRAVELVKGEAYFEIHHDAARPFVVTVFGHRIVDLGTKFLIRTTSQALKVELVEGSARLETMDSHVPEHAVTLTSGDLAVATAGTVKISKRPARDVQNALAWRRGVIALHNASLADAAAEFNRYGGTQLIVADADAAKLTINGTFGKTEVEEFAGMTHEIFGLRIQHQNGAIVLSR